VRIGGRPAAALAPPAPDLPEAGSGYRDRADLALETLEAELRELPQAAG
jgi:hypothetical protein